MAKLTAKQRRKLPKSKFADPAKAPGSGSFPLNDKAHIRAAESYERFASPSAKKKIDAAAAKAFPGGVKGKKKGGKKKK